VPTTRCEGEEVLPEVEEEYKQKLKSFFQKMLKYFQKMLVPIFTKNVGENILKNVKIHKCWCNSFEKILIQLFIKNVGATFKNVTTFCN
jgi:hypothetical protein